MSQNITSMKTSLDTAEDGKGDDTQKPKRYARDSLDRFGDDLFVILLTYLSFEDRFRLEGVSQQFKRTVFESVVDITPNYRFMGNIFKTEMLATITRKCPNVVRLDFRQLFCHLDLIPEVINTFGVQLREIYCNLKQNSGEWMAISVNELQYTYGSLVKRINVCDSSAKQSLIHCNQLLRLSVKNLRDVFDTTSGQLLAKNLHTFDMRCLLYSSEQQLLPTFIAGNQSLKSLAINARFDLNEMCVQLSRLTQLRELKLELNGVNGLPEFLRTIGTNCKQLQRFSLSMNVFHHFLNDKTLDPLKSYRRLKHLHLTRFGHCSHGCHQVLQPLRFCQRIKHLSLDLCRIYPELFKGCDKQWPRLQYLSIQDNNTAIDTEYLDNISSLPALKTLIINGKTSDDLLDTDLNAVLSSSTKLKNIEIYENNEKKFYSK